MPLGTPPHATVRTDSADAQALHAERVTSRPLVRKRMSRWHIAGLMVVVGAVTGVLLASQRAAILTWAGALLIAEDSLVHADVIVPLVGGTWDREIEAAELFRAGYAPRVVLTIEPSVPTQTYLAQRGIKVSDPVEDRLQVLSALGVPANRVTVIRKPVTSTFDEARFIGAWAAETSIRTIIVVSSPQHTARAKYIFERCAGSVRTTFVVRPTRLGEFRADSWWMSRAMLRDGIFELQKLLAYRLVY